MQGLSAVGAQGAERTFIGFGYTLSRTEERRAFLGEGKGFQEFSLTLDELSQSRLIEGNHGAGLCARLEAWIVQSIEAKGRRKKRPCGLWPGPCAQKPRLCVRRSRDNRRQGRDHVRRGRDVRQGRDHERQSW